MDFSQQILIIAVVVMSAVVVFALAVRYIFSAVRSEMEEIRKEQREEARANREEQSNGLKAFSQLQSERFKEIGDMQSEKLTAFSNQLADISKLNESKIEAMRATIDSKMTELYKNNEKKLDEMRQTVDEKLHDTLEKRLGESFKTVSERLEQVHKGLGEMKGIASDMGDLRRIFSNVKVRGTWGEMQLGAILEQIMAPAQYETNVAVVPRRSERVEFAIKLPGVEEGKPVWLPIDSKFPLEDYQRLVTASEQCDAEAVEREQKALKKRILDEAKDIKTKYVSPPHTTNFGILYLPTEGLYAEVLRIDGLAESLTADYRVIPAGPTTIVAMLNSLQVGFRSLAIQKRSNEVWVLLGQVKGEFEKFGAILEKTRDKLDAAGKELDKIDGRTKQINKRLSKVESIESEKELKEPENKEIESGE